MAAWLVPAACLIPGNQGFDLREVPTWPAAYSLAHRNVLTVGASALRGEWSDYSSWGPGAVHLRWGVACRRQWGTNTCTMLRNNRSPSSCFRHWLAGRGAAGAPRVPRCGARAGCCSGWTASNRRMAHVAQPGCDPPTWAAPPCHWQPAARLRTQRHPTPLPPPARLAAPPGHLCCPRGLEGSQNTAQVRNSTPFLQQSVNNDVRNRPPPNGKALETSTAATSGWLASRGLRWESTPLLARIDCPEPDETHVSKAPPTPPPHTHTALHHASLPSPLARHIDGGAVCERRRGAADGGHRAAGHAAEGAPPAAGDG